MKIWTRWMQQPQRVWLRKALFQIHLWTGIAVGLYVLVISVTGSVLVYRNELFRAATRAPVIVVPSGERLSDAQLSRAALGIYPGFELTELRRARNLDQAVDVTLRRGSDVRRRMFGPYSGKDLGNTVPFGIKAVSWLLDLHDNLLGGTTGRVINGAGALLLLVLGTTGLIVWWPGIQKWRGSLIVHRHVSWKRFNWDLHSALGIWSVPFVLLFGVTGAYLGVPALFGTIADSIEPMTDANAGTRVVDSITYWLAYLHFGRLGGRGIPGCGPMCNTTTKVIWALYGLVPAALFVTGALMWWSRVVRPKQRKRAASFSKAHSLDGQR